MKPLEQAVDSMENKLLQLCEQARACLMHWINDKVTTPMDKQFQKMVAELTKGVDEYKTSQLKPLANCCRNCEEEIRPLKNAKEIPVHTNSEKRTCENNKTIAEYKNNQLELSVRRTPIYLGKNAIAVLHIFTRYDHLEDTWMFDSETLEQQNWKTPEKAAEQFIEQLEKWWTPAFMMQLRNQIEQTLIKHDKKYKTKFAKRSA